ncbi:hypothetical protein NIES4071_108240 (plasmid) [Calothrix sp. NIES-4071]|nr:hypothetical protein NIES4071_108240 [Calothrix sp. NIES-4071]BAZ64864.1 hypothetical protein NIES4105_105970 [Calothrix sp. NIES-4105]
MNLVLLVERYEEQYGELAPELKPHNKKPWYASYTQRGQVAELQEMIYLSGNSARE